MAESLGIIGLGRTGMPAAQAFLAAGYRIIGYDVERELREVLSSIGGKAVESPQQVASQAHVILVMVLNDEQVLEVMEGPEGVLGSASTASTIVCMSTVNRHIVEYLAQLCESRQISFVDCPFTGGPARISEGTLTLITAAHPDALSRVRPKLEVIGQIVEAGERPGMGQAVKHCNQLLVSTTHAATMEVIALARKLGLDTTMVKDVLASGIAGSDYFRLLAESVLNNTPSPGSLGQMCKDVAIVVNTTRENKVPALVATATSHYFLMAEASNMYDQEGARLIDVVERDPGSSGHQRG